MTNPGLSGEDTGVPASPSREMHMQWHTEAGLVLFYFPSNMAAQDAADVRALLDIALQGIDRRAAEISQRTTL